MADEPSGRGLSWLLLAKAMCCGGILLAATGALSLGGLTGWLLEGGIVWLAVAALGIVAVYFWWRRHAGRPPAWRQDQGTAPRRRT